MNLIPWEVILVLVLISGASIGAQIYKKKQKDRWNRSFKYRKNKYLMSKAELSLYGCLLRTIKDNEDIHSKVRLADLLKPNNKTRKKQSAGFTRIRSKHLDFIIVDKKTSEIKYAIELDDNSHSRKDRSERDVFVNEACLSAGLVLIRIKARASYNTTELREILGDIKAKENEYRRAN